VSLPEQFTRYARRAEEALERALSGEAAVPEHLREAMRYSATGPGKRLRPSLVYATGEALGIAPGQLDGPAAAVELIHAYSLIHDDLPAMDNDDLRRGRPTCHKAYGEATAILVGDALLTLAFETLASDLAMETSPAQRLRMVATLAAAAGAGGMVGGQALDMAATGRRQNLEELETIHNLKTGALLRASVRLACLSRADLADENNTQLDHYGKCIGLAFQIQDDVLDEESDTATLGKAQGADQAQEKSTFPALIGLSEAKRRANALADEALTRLASFDQRADNLRALARYIVARDH
jgi:farnesyl diphosphate synthase